MIAMALITYLVAILVGYASYLHYHDQLFPKARGAHYEGPGKTYVYQVPNVQAYLQYIGGEITRNEWLKATGRLA